MTDLYPIGNPIGKYKYLPERTARDRLPDTSALYLDPMPPLVPGGFKFTTTLIPGRKNGKPTSEVPLGDAVTAVTWSEENSLLSGSIELRRPKLTQRASLPVGLGQTINLKVAWGSATYDLWTLRVSGSDASSDTNGQSVSLADGSMTLELGDEMYLLQISKRDWTYRRTKSKRPFFADDITRDVCRRMGVKTGVIMNAVAPIDKLIKKNTSGIDVIREVWRAENKETSVRIVIGFRNGKLEVRPYRRNKTLYTIGDLVTEATIQQLRKASPATVITGKGTIGKGKATKKIKTEPLFIKSVVERFGNQHKDMDFGRVKSKADLRNKTLRALAGEIRITHQATVTHPGIPFLRKGDAVELDVGGDEGFDGRSAIVYVGSITHRVTPDLYEMDLSLFGGDPYETLRVQEKERDARAKARARRAARKATKTAS